MGLHSFLSVPLRAHGRTLGVVAAWRSTTPAPYTADDLALLREIADRAAMGIQNALLYRDAAESAAAAKRTMYAHDEFLALVSHDLENPLATIYGTAQLVRRQVTRGLPVEGARLVTDMKAIESAIAKANREIDASLDMARLHMGEQLALEADTTDIVALLQGLADEYGPLTDRHTITVNASTPQLLGTWDGPRLERAFSNLLNNAVKYSPDGGAIEIDIRLEKDAGEEYVVVTVRDHGLGIPAAALPRVFDRFYRAENVERYGGSGLGLSGVRYIIEAHLGVVSVDSEERVGSTFTVRLPRPVVEDRDDDSSEPSFDTVAATPPVAAS
jgi:signal transduction histidine kinase